MRYKSKDCGFQLEIDGVLVNTLHLHTPAIEGVQETGTHTSEVNSLVLFIHTDRRFNNWLQNIFELTYKYLCRSGNVFERYKKEPMTTEWCFSFNGVGALNDISEALHNRTKLLIKTSVQQHNKLCPDSQVDLTEFVHTQDLHNHLIREFQRWCNEYKRIPA